MAAFRYWFYDYSTGGLLDVLPVENVSFGWEVRVPGAFSGEIPLFDDKLDSQRVLDATIPIRTKVFVEREGTLVWGGQVTEPRSYDSSTMKLTVNAEETISGLTRRFMPTLQLYGKDQIYIAEHILSALQGVASGNLGVAVVDNTGGTSGVSRDGVYSQYDFTDALSSITDLSELQDGFDFVTSVVWDSSHNPQETLILAYPRLGRSRTASPIVLEFHRPTGGGNVVSYTWPEGPGLHTKTWANATTPDGVQLTASYTAGQLLQSGWPLDEQKIDYTAGKPTDVATLQSYANAQGMLASGFPVAATFTVVAAPGLEIGDWSVGDDALVRITDYRFPQQSDGSPGFHDYMRIGKATCSVDQSGMEQYTFTMVYPTGLNYPVTVT